jgi:hypothetical protein
MPLDGSMRAKLGWWREAAGPASVSTLGRRP